MNWPSCQEFRRHRAVEQGCSLPPPAPQASIVLLPVRKPQIGREILSQNQVKKFHSNPEPRQRGGALSTIIRMFTTSCPAAASVPTAGHACHPVPISSWRSVRCRFCFEPSSATLSRVHGS
jgi:hypothetical protein